MLTALCPSRLTVGSSRFTPAFLEPLLTKARSGEPLEPVVREIVASLGFNSLMYGMSTASHPQQESRSYVWTTLPREWVQLYDERAYIEVDPRLTETWRRVTPYVWDRDSVPRNPKVAGFLEDAARFGVGSGVAVSLWDVRYPRVIVAFNSSERDFDDARRTLIVNSLGDMILFATHFHELFMKNVVDVGLPPLHRGVPLTPRERQVLQMAAHGLTSGDIALKLGVAERTVTFHFCNILSKMAAANRGEAIALAVVQGLVSV